MSPGRSRRRCCVLLVLGLGLGGPAWAQSAQEEAAAGAAEEQPAGLRPRLDFGLEARTNFRHSELNRFPVPFPFRPDQLPPGQTQAFEETVNPGSHLELSAVTLLVDAVWGDGLARPIRPPLRLGAVSISRSASSPNSSGRMTGTWRVMASSPPRSTASRRLAPSWGPHLGRHVYLKLSVTQGNPVFIRDPNALAGDNGTPTRLRPNPDPELTVLLPDAT